MSLKVQDRFQESPTVLHLNPDQIETHDVESRVWSRLYTGCQAEDRIQVLI